MAWGRGLFRVWLVASVLWAMTVVAFSYQDISRVMKQPKFRTDVTADELSVEKVPPDFLFLYHTVDGPPIDGDIRVYDEEGDILWFDSGGVDESMTDEWQVLLGAAVNKVNRVNALKNAQRWQNVSATLRALGVLATVPAAFFFALGWSVLWALRGFRKGT